MGIPLTALAIQQPPNPVDQMGRAVALKGLMQNQQYNEQMDPLLLQQHQQAIQEQQDIVEQRKALRQAYAQAIQPDEKGQPQINADILTKALANSNHGDAIPGILESIDKYQQSKNALMEQGMKIKEAGADMVGHAASAVKAANYDPNVAHTILDTFGDAPQIQQLRQLIDSNPQAFKQQIDSAINASPAQQKLQNERDIAKIRAGGGGANPLGDKIPAINQALERRYQVLNPGKPLPPELSLRPDATQKDFDNADKILQQTESAQGTKAQQDVSNELHRQTLALSQNKQTNEDKAIEGAAQALASGDLTRIKDIASMRGDQRLLIYNRAKELNPKFNTANVDRQIKTMELYTTGKQGDQLQSFGTFLEHAGALKDQMDNLSKQGLTSSKLLNHSINWLRSNVSDDPAYPRVLAALDPVQKEFESYLLNNRALYTEDRATVDKIISGDMPIGQVVGSLQQMGHTVQARYNEADHRFRGIMGKGIEEMVGPISEEAKAGASKIGAPIGSGNQSSTTGTAKPAGATHTGIGSVDKKKHWLDVSGKDLGLAE